VSIVIDASMTIAWLFRNQRSEQSRLVLRRVVLEDAVVPSIWRLEVANVLRTSTRRGHCTEAFAGSCLLRLGRLRIMVDPETDARAWSVTRDLSRTFNLTLYDAAYLELAVRLQVPIASLDKALCDAARAASVEALGL
jgi:predicted nucleic acid-binding protein